MSAAMSHLPVIDVAPLLGEGLDLEPVALEIRRACQDAGFFYVSGHGVGEDLQGRLERLSRIFFAQDDESKMVIRMERGGRAWRGYFPVGAELTSGRPDRKEGLYFGAELADDHPRVRAGVVLHGRNLFPDIAGFRETVLEYMAPLTHLGHALMRGIALSLDLESSYFHDRYTAEPLVLFRIFNYPPPPVLPEGEWGVGEHTDYGMLTILRQDHTGGLEVRTPSGWLDAPPLPGTFVCNIGDMLDRMTGGRYRSTPHRVRHASASNRLSFPFFFDPDFDAVVHPIVSPLLDDAGQRWDGSSVHQFQGTYGDYIQAKVARVFPRLRENLL
jgi:isopenicillin N synthase-like dioxygenase